MDPTPPLENLVFFDGYCNLCCATVQFLIRQDPEARLRFVSLQSKKGRSLLQNHRLPPKALDSVLFYQDGVLFARSDAALRIARTLGRGWQLLYGFVLVPRLLRDWVYDCIAANRYRWFGRSTSCWLPTPELEARFLE